MRDSRTSNGSGIRQVVGLLLTSLPSLNAEVMRMRYGIGRAEATPLQVSEALGCSLVEVQAIERQSMEMLKGVA